MKDVRLGSRLAEVKSVVVPVYKRIGRVANTNKYRSDLLKKRVKSR